MEGRNYRPALLMQPDDVAAVVLNALTLSLSAEVTEINVRPLIKSHKPAKRITANNLFTHLMHEYVSLT